MWGYLGGSTSFRHILTIFKLPVEIHQICSVWVGAFLPRLRHKPIISVFPSFCLLCLARCLVSIGCASWIDMQRGTAGVLCKPLEIMAFRSQFCCVLLCLWGPCVLTAAAHVPFQPGPFATCLSLSAVFPVIYQMSLSNKAENTLEISLSIEKHACGYSHSGGCLSSCMIQSCLIFKNTVS